jgi:hypothetical protein
MKDEHLWPGYGTPGGNTIDWPVVIPILAALPDATPGILEPACDRDETLESVTRKASTVFSDHVLRNGLRAHNANRISHICNRS